MLSSNYPEIVVAEFPEFGDIFSEIILRKHKAESRTTNEEDTAMLK